MNGATSPARPLSAFDGNTRFSNPSLSETCFAAVSDARSPLPVETVMPA